MGGGVVSMGSRINLPIFASDLSTTLRGTASIPLVHARRPNLVLA